MAIYNKLFFCLNRRRANTNNELTTLAVHSFIDTSLDLSDILTPGFFSSYFGFEASDIIAGDLVYIGASDATQVMRVIDAATPTLSSLNLLQASLFGAVAITWSGPWVSPVVSTFNYEINTNTCTIMFPQVAATAASGANITAQLPTLVNASLFPLAAFDDEVAAINNGGGPHASVTITTGGLITIAGLPPGNGTGSGSYGFYPFALKYPVTTIEG